MQVKDLDGQILNSGPHLTEKQKEAVVGRAQRTRQT